MRRVSRQKKLGSKRVHFPTKETICTIISSSVGHSEDRITMVSQKESDHSLKVRGQGEEKDSSEPVVGARGDQGYHRLLKSVLVPNDAHPRQHDVDPLAETYVRLGAKKQINRVQGRHKQLIPSSMSVAPRFVIEVTTPVGKFKRMLDTGADCSVTGLDNITAEQGTKKPTLLKWKGGPVGTIHDAFRVEGAWKEITETNNGNLIGAKFCVVSERLEMPILGLDWMHHYRACRNWETNELVWVDPRSGERCRAPILSSTVTDLRITKDTKIKKGMMQRVNVLCHGARKGEAWVLEPSPATEHGALRVERQISIVDEEGVIPLWISNWSVDESVTAKKGALLAIAHDQFKIREVHKVTDNEVHAEDQWYDGTDKIKYVNRVIRRVVEKVGKKVNHATQSYEEMMKGVMEKEEVDKARVAKSFSQKIQTECMAFIKQWAKVFAANPFSPPPLDNGVNLRIPLDKEAVAVKDTPTRMSPEQHRIVEEHILLMLKHGIIECSNSPWGARVVLAKKKDGKWRFCVDYRYLNSVTKKDAYPLPRIDDTLEALGGEDARVFSSLDVASGYWHIPLFSDDREKTAFVTRNGQYQFRVVPFGLTGAPGAFCRYMDDTLRDIMWKRCLVYVDDIIVWAKDIKEHMKALEEVFERLLKAGLKLKLSKCEFFLEEVEYLGFVIGHGVVGLSPAKVRSIEEIPPPRTIKQLQRFLGAVNWMGRWIFRKAELAFPLTCLLGQEKPKFEVHIPGTPQNLAFLALKKALTSFPVLRLPDFKKTFYVMTDASIVATGAMLAQIWDGYEHPVSYYGKALRDTQQKWHPFELETYAVVLALRAFRHYIAASNFIVVTDCKALTYFNSTREVSPKIVRWLGEISQYGARFIHRSGERNVIPDWQSRDLSHLNSLTAEEMKESMAKGVHNAPLHLCSQEEGVGIGKASFKDYKKGARQTINHIKFKVDNITMSKVAAEQEENAFCKQVVDFFTSGKVPTTKDMYICL
jgi:hypothetical protein